MKSKLLFKKIWLWFVAVLLIIAVTACGGGKENTGENTPKGTTDNTPETTAEGTPKNTSEPTDTVTWIKEGMYKVGSDIPAGEYVLYSDGSISYYQVSKDSTGSIESIISNDNFTGNRYVTVKDGQYIELKGSKMLPIDKAEPFKPVDGKYVEGMYKVGRDIEAGEYKLVPDGSAYSYMEVTKDSLGTLDSIVANDNFTAEKYVTISAGQYIKLVGCYIAVK